MKLAYKSSVIVQLKKLPKREVKKILRKLNTLTTDPYVGKMLKGELEGLRSLRAWPYRIIYEIKGKSIIIFSIAHRQGVYK